MDADKAKICQACGGKIKKEFCTNHPLGVGPKWKEQARKSGWAG